MAIHCLVAMGVSTTILTGCVQLHQEMLPKPLLCTVITQLDVVLQNHPSTNIFQCY